MSLVYLPRQELLVHGQDLGSEQAKILPCQIVTIFKDGRAECSNTHSAAKLGNRERKEDVSRVLLRSRQTGQQNPIVRDNIVPGYIYKSMLVYGNYLG